MVDGQTQTVKKLKRHNRLCHQWFDHFLDFFATRLAKPIILHILPNVFFILSNIKQGENTSNNITIKIILIHEKLVFNSLQCDIFNWFTLLLQKRITNKLRIFPLSNYSIILIKLKILLIKCLRSDILQILQIKRNLKTLEDSQITASFFQSMIPLNPLKNPRYPVTAKTSLPIETIPPPLPQGGSPYLYDPRVWRFPQRSVRVVDIRKHKSRGDTIVRHSGPFFIVQPGASREIRRRCARANGAVKIF